MTLAAKNLCSDYLKDYSTGNKAYRPPTSDDRNSVHSNNSGTGTTVRAQGKFGGHASKKSGKVDLQRRPPSVQRILLRDRATMSCYSTLIHEASKKDVENEGVVNRKEVIHTIITEKSEVVNDTVHEEGEATPTHHPRTLDLPTSTPSSPHTFTLPTEITTLSSPLSLQPPPPVPSTPVHIPPLYKSTSPKINTPPIPIPTLPLTYWKRFINREISKNAIGVYGDILENITYHINNSNIRLDIFDELDEIIFQYVINKFEFDFKKSNIYTRYLGKCIMYNVYNYICIIYYSIVYIIHIY